MIDLNNFAGFVVGWLISLVCIILGILFLTGRGFKLIAKHKPPTEPEKQTYNIKALCRAVGLYILCTGIVIGLSVTLIYNGLDLASTILLIVFLIATVPFLVYLNKGKRFKK